MIIYWEKKEGKNSTDEQVKILETIPCKHTKINDYKK